MTIVNRVEFDCAYHGALAHGKLTFNDDHTFRCWITCAGGESRALQGSWRVTTTGYVCLTTPHGYVEVMLQVLADQRLLGLDQFGGHADFDIRGQKSTVLPRALV